MAFLNKLKGIFFDEVEDDEESKTEEISIKEIAHEEEKKEEPIREVKPLVEEEKVPERVTPISTNDDFNERELFRSSRTFEFTEFNEPEEEELPKRRSVLDFDNVMEEKREPVLDERIVSTPKPVMSTTTTTSDQPKVFKPSPIISPIYGILDKDYKKEEIVEREKSVSKDESISKVTTYDTVRRKAYGTLEDDLEDSLNEINKLSSKEVNEKIEESRVIDTDDLTDASKAIAEINEKTQKIEDLITKIEETSDQIDRSMTIGDLEDTAEIIERREKVVEPEPEPVVEQPAEEEKEDKTMTDSTLEHDLFNLIDSMYDDKED